MSSKKHVIDVTSLAFDIICIKYVACLDKSKVGTLNSLEITKWKLSIHVYITLLLLKSLYSKGFLRESYCERKILRNSTTKIN